MICDKKRSLVQPDAMQRDVMQYDVIQNVFIATTVLESKCSLHFLPAQSQWEEQHKHNPLWTSLNTSRIKVKKKHYYMIAWRYLPFKGKTQSRARGPEKGWTLVPTEIQQNAWRLLQHRRSVMLNSDLFMKPPAPDGPLRAGVLLLDSGNWWIF